MMPGDYTPRQGQYLAFIYYYTKLNSQPPAETDMQRYFRVSAPAVHHMVVTLEQKGFIEAYQGTHVLYGSCSPVTHCPIWRDAVVGSAPALWCKKRR